MSLGRGSKWVWKEGFLEEAALKGDEICQRERQLTKPVGTRDWAAVCVRVQIELSRGMS